nr:MAG TPA: hypothetical protein [Caudoviricetes sp.]
MHLSTIKCIVFYMYNKQLSNRLIVCCTLYTIFN